MQLVLRAHRVHGVPRGVVAWIDHERHGELLLLNADWFTIQHEVAFTAVLADGAYTAPRLLDALTTTGR